MSQIIATFFYVGYLRPASGTWGSAAAIPVAALLHWLGGFPLLVVATILAFVAGVWATGEMIKSGASDDPSEVVMDEVVGQWIALYPLSAGLWFAGSDTALLALWPGWVAGFFLFRFFDILKPGPIGWADRRHDALGVMLDDVFAGIAAGICVAALAAVAHGGMGL